MRLRTKYALVLLVILLVLGTVVVGSAELFKQQTVAQEQNELDDTTELAAGQIDEAITDQKDIIRQLAPTIDTESDEIREEQLQQLLDNHDFSVALVVDSEGYITSIQGLHDDEQQTMVGTHVTEAGFLSPETTEAVLDGSTQIERVHSFEGSDDFALTMGAPVLSPDGQEVEGALVGSLFIEFTRLFSAVTPLETTQQTVSVTGQTFAGERATILEAEDSFDDVLRSDAAISETGWTLTVERDETALTSQLQFLQFIQFGSLLVVLLTVFGLGFYQYRTTLRQTAQLLGGFDELTDGNFEYSVNLGAAEEWNKISQGFNSMVDDLQTRERQIRERERRLSVLNRVLRHNLQNDMTVIQGYAEVVASMDNREQREQAADKILEKARGLVDHGKKARRLETVMENAEEGSTRLDIGSNIRETLQSYESEYPDFTVEFDETGEMWIDAVSGIEFGIEELIENAFLYNTSDAPLVNVTVDRSGDEVVVTVRDNGPGIPEHEWEVLVQDEETSLEHGSGIGLWLAYWSVIKSDGELEFGDQTDGGVAIARLNGCPPPEDAG